MLEIIFEDDDLAFVNKPHGLAMHKSHLVRNTKDFLVDQLKVQLNMSIYSVHRLDRKTSGVLVVAKNLETAQFLSAQFVENKISKSYYAIVRGHFNDVDLDHALVNEKGVSQNSSTSFINISKTEVPIPLGKHASSRYSLIKAIPKTGRMHQIRRHLAHLRHPIIGDRPHGCNKQNRLFKSTWEMTTMMLHSRTIDFLHPRSLERMTISAEFSDEFKRVHSFLNFENDLNSLK